MFETLSEVAVEIACGIAALVLTSIISKRELHPAMGMLKSIALGLALGVVYALVSKAESTNWMLVILVPPLTGFVTSYAHRESGLHREIDRVSRHSTFMRGLVAGLCFAGVHFAYARWIVTR